MKTYIATISDEQFKTAERHIHCADWFNYEAECFAFDDPDPRQFTLFALLGIQLTRVENCDKGWRNYVKKTMDTEWLSTGRCLRGHQYKQKPSI